MLLQEVVLRSRDKPWLSHFGLSFPMFMILILTNMGNVNVLLSNVASNASTICFLWVCIEHLSDAFFCFKDLITHPSYRW
jgi:hypothetical protein